MSNLIFVLSQQIASMVFWDIWSLILIYGWLQKEV